MIPPNGSYSNRKLLSKGLTVQNPFANFCLRWVDRVLRFCVTKKPMPLPPNPKRILLANIANLGDVVIATTVIPSLQKQFPNAKIDFLVNSMAKEVVAHHPAISIVHVFDHFYLRKSFQALLRHFKTARAAKREIRSLHYDIAIDLQPFFPNAIPFLHRSGIPSLLGYATGGFGSLLTHSYPDECGFDCYMGKNHLKLLEQAGMPISMDRPLPYYPSSGSGAVSRDYIVVHMGSSRTEKKWVREEWVSLINQLQKMAPVVLTGKGNREGDQCAVVAMETGAQDLSNQLDWQEFATIVQKAELVITVDSAAVHLAAASQTPCLVIFSEINPPSLWIPDYAKCKALIHRRSNAISAQEALGAALKLLKP